MDFDPRPHWAWFAVGLLVYLGGAAAKRILWGADSDPATLPRWRQVGRASMRYQPTVWGALAAFVPGLPMGVEGTSLGTRLIYFACAGACCQWIYDVVQDAYRWARRKLGARASRPPSESGWASVDVAAVLLAIAVGCALTAVLYTVVHGVVP